MEGDFFLTHVRTRLNCEKVSLVTIPLDAMTIDDSSHEHQALR